MDHLISLQGVAEKTIKDLINQTTKIKKNKSKYYGTLKNNTMLMIFEKPSLRTRVSFEVAMTQLGGHAIHLDSRDSPMGKKESIADTAKASSRYCDVIMARMFKQENVEELAKNSKVPVINGLTNIFHPCQILSDFFTIFEKKGKLKGMKLCFVGDGNNNITHSLLLGCSLVGMDISVGCPKKHSPQSWIVNIAKKNSKKSGSKVLVTDDAEKAAKGADILYADSWMSYHIGAEEKEERLKTFKPYQVNKELMNHAKKDAIFMNCLPAMRGQEQTADVIDGEHSVVFDQAENRLHMQKAIILELMGKI